MVTSCRICGQDLLFRWTSKVFGDRYDADYYECQVCHALQVPHPHWLAEAYAHEAQAPSPDNHDSGRFRRNFSAYSYLAALRKASVVPERGVVLDYGGGYGLLTQMLLDAGYESWSADAHVPNPYFAANRVVASLVDVPANTFDTVVALEVFEHLTDPLAVGSELARTLKEDGTLVISTEIYDPERHDESWAYLAREGGQHVTFWSRSAVRKFAHRFAFRSIGYFPGDSGFLIVFSKLPSTQLTKRLAAAAAHFNDPGFWQDITAQWDFRNVGIVTHCDQPVVDTIDLANATRRSMGRTLRFGRTHRR